MLSIVSRIIKPRYRIGRIVGALASAIGIPTLGMVADLDLTLIAITAIVMAFGYLAGWSTDKIKEMIRFLNELSKEKPKKVK